jgi:outer membrane protein assembly factor BamA
LIYEKNIAANYFGLDDRSLGRLTFPGSPEKFASVSDYTDALRQVQPDGTAFTRYNQYVLERPQASATLERDFFGGVVRALVGVRLAYANVEQWTGETVKADTPTANDVDARQAPTRLDRDCAAGLVVGCGGGITNALKLGLAYDTRDFEPDPNSGVFVELTGELSGKYTLSDYDWARLTFSPRVYYSPFPKLTDLVVAGRFVGSVQSDGTPFFEMNQLSFADYNREGLGGLRTIRGFNQNRYVGHVVALANVELRWTFYDFDFKKQHFGLMLAPFLDVGRVFDSLSDLELKRFRNGQGAGFRIAWNQATIVVIDYGVSREGSTLYVNFNHPF